MANDHGKGFRKFVEVVDEGWAETPIERDEVNFNEMLIGLDTFARDEDQHGS